SSAERACPDPPAELGLDVYGVEEYGTESEVARRRMLTIRARGPRRGGPPSPTGAAAEGDDLASLVTECLAQLDPGWEPETPRRSAGAPRRRLGAVTGRARALRALMSEQAVRLVFLKQVRDAAQGDHAVLQQVVESRSSVTAGSMRWRRLRG